MNSLAKVTAANLPWEDILVWTGLLLVLYALHDVFLLVFLTFLLTYLVRAIVIPLARRISPDRERPGLERWLTLGTFVAIVALLWGFASLVVPQFVLQARLLTSHAERLAPQQMLDHFLARTVGAYLFNRTYGGPGRPAFPGGLRSVCRRRASGRGCLRELRTLAGGGSLGL